MVSVELLTSGAAAQGFVGGFDQLGQARLREREVVRPLTCFSRRAWTLGAA